MIPLRPGENAELRWSHHPEIELDGRIVPEHWMIRAQVGDHVWIASLAPSAYADQAVREAMEHDALDRAWEMGQ